MEPAKFTQNNPYGFTREQILENVTDAAKFAADPIEEDKDWWDGQTDYFVTYAKNNGISLSEMFEHYRKNA